MTSACKLHVPVANWVPALIYALLGSLIWSVFLVGCSVLCCLLFLLFRLFLQSMTLSSSPKHSALHVTPSPLLRHMFFMALSQLLLHSCNDSFKLRLFICLFNSSLPLPSCFCCVLCPFCLHAQLLAIHIATCNTSLRTRHWSRSLTILLCTFGLALLHFASWVRSPGVHSPAWSAHTRQYDIC